MPTGSVDMKTTEVLLTMAELTSRDDHINQIWTRMYLTLHQTFITLLLFFQSKQTWLCIQIRPPSFPPQYHFLKFYCASAYNKRQVTRQHEWITTDLLIFKSQLVQKQKMFFLFLSKGHNKSGPQALAFDSYSC